MRGTLSLFGACAMVAGAAQAQSAVTLYGVIDTNVEYASHLSSGTGGYGSRVALVSGGLSGSRWGLRGTEDLGGGLSAVFALESGFGVDDGKSQQGGRLFGRQAFVGLQNKSWGAVTLGRQYSTMFDALGNFVPMTYATQYEPFVYLEGSQLRSDNTVKYTGVFGPVTAEAHWSFGNGVAGTGENPGQFRRDTGYGGALTYASGPVGIVLVYDQANPSLTGTGGGFVGTGTNKRAAIAGSYAAGPATVMAGYRWQRNENSAGREIFRDDFYWLGLNYRVTAPLVLKLGYYYADAKNSNGVNPSNPWQVSFIADYALSKRTDLYLTTAFAKNSGLNFDGSYALATGKNEMMGAALGVRHKF
ncbi:porin [Cupriavidus numazuensis]|uniref:Outer membrane porin protein n=1 Tax=Cupriavidus numazuensis TaxID=221992 RepID=A0ABM8TV65_9BURK|nr:porin [Cupriavidus numazuensis]CAG2160414.1 Outer membrane porin protein [Cupriavidus numazuensis]